MVRFLYRIILLLVFVLGFAVPCLALGHLTIYNQTATRSCTIDSDDGVLIDPLIDIGNGSTAWPGGDIHVIIDPVANGNIFDRLTCTLASTTMSSAYSIADHTLVITANSTITTANIRDTLRTIRFKTSGMNGGLRTIRIVVRETGYYFLKQTGHIYYYQNSVTGTYAAQKAAADALVYYGMHGYNATATTTAEFTLLNSFAPSTAVWIWAPGIRTDPDTWNWDDGPEAGQRIVVGATTLVQGSTTLWQSSQPQYTTEHNLLYGFGGLGDWDAGELLFTAYEFGGMPTDANTIHVRVVSQNALLIGIPF